MFQGSVNGTGNPLNSTVFPFTFPPVRHCVPSHFNCKLQPSAHITPTVSPQHIPHTKTLTNYSSQHLLIVSQYTYVLCSPEIIYPSSVQYPTYVNLTESLYYLLMLFQSKSVACPELFGGVSVQQILRCWFNELNIGHRTERTGLWGR